MQYDYEEKWDFHNTPFYEEIDEQFLVIGVIHQNIEKKSPWRDFKSWKNIRRFRRKIRSLDNLLFEGSRTTFERVGKLVQSNNYEMLALSEHKGRQYFLEENVDLLSILHEQGITPEMAALYLTLERLSGFLYETVYKEPFVKAALPSKIKLNLDILPISYPWFKKLPSEKLTEQIMRGNQEY